MEEQNRQAFCRISPGKQVAEWEAKIREDLKGADYEKKLIWKTLEEFKIKPYYTAEDLHGSAISATSYRAVSHLCGGDKTTGNAWEIRQDFRVSDTGTASAESQDWLLNSGVTSSDLILPQREICITTISGS